MKYNSNFLAVVFTSLVFAGIAMLTMKAIGFLDSWTWYGAAIPIVAAFILLAAIICIPAIFLVIVLFFVFVVMTCAIVVYLDPRCIYNYYVKQKLMIIKEKILRWFHSYKNKEGRLQ